MHDYCVFDYFLFNLVTISVCELYKVHDYSVFNYFLFNLSFSVSELQKAHDYFVFHYFLFDLISISGGELRKVHDYCLAIYSSFLSPFQEVSYMKCMIIVCMFDYNISLQSCHHFRR